MLATTSRKDGHTTMNDNGYDLGSPILGILFTLLALAILMMA